MKNSNPALRSYEPIGWSDFERLLALARRDREEFFRRYPDWDLYRDRILGTALCQGAALHYIRPEVGINDFDVYTFYAAHPHRRWYAKRRRAVDLGDPRFGRSEVAPPHFVGRRVDLLGRTLDVVPETDLVEPSNCSKKKEIKDRPARTYFCALPTFHDLMC